MPKVYIRTAARSDLMGHYMYLAENANLDTAERFMLTAEISFSKLLAHPFIGAPIILRNPALVGLRKWPIKDFNQALIFYLPRNSDITIIRVLNASRDWWSLLGIKA